VLRAYIREIDQNGLLDEVPLDSGSVSSAAMSASVSSAAMSASSAGTSVSSAGMNQDRWLENVLDPKQPLQLEKLPSAVDSLGVDLESTTAKERVVHEEGFKLLQSMKSNQAKPETGPAEVKKSLANETETDSRPENLAALQNLTLEQRQNSIPTFFNERYAFQPIVKAHAPIPRGQPQYYSPAGKTNTKSPIDARKSREEHDARIARPEYKGKWRDFTAAGVGGAALSLLSVLSEAAENM
jgi:hypothetical protein